MTVRILDRAGIMVYNDFFASEHLGLAINTDSLKTKITKVIKEKPNLSYSELKEEIIKIINTVEVCLMQLDTDKEARIFNSGGFLEIVVDSQPQGFMMITKIEGYTLPFGSVLLKDLTATLEGFDLTEIQSQLNAQARAPYMEIANDSESIEEFAKKLNELSTDDIDKNLTNLLNIHHQQIADVVFSVNAQSSILPSSFPERGRPETNAVMHWASQAAMRRNLIKDLAPKIGGHQVDIQRFVEERVINRQDATNYVRTLLSLDSTLTLQEQNNPSGHEQNKNMESLVYVDVLNMTSKEYSQFSCSEKGALIEYRALGVINLNVTDKEKGWLSVNSSGAVPAVAGGFTQFAFIDFLGSRGFGRNIQVGVELATGAAIDWYTTRNNQQDSVFGVGASSSSLVGSMARGGLIASEGAKGPSSQEAPSLK
ncbi:MAG: hypothetical protein V4496_07880 [Pseudomonadota bacterium]